ncbi:hypothetical protein HD554DRAFT_1239038 [Boletus coccyginus]|nr:hypothetical protein HD554DRAFT_1239038 [Boletus coccyginus]
MCNVLRCLTSRVALASWFWTSFFLWFLVNSDGGINIIGRNNSRPSRLMISTCISGIPAYAFLLLS